MHLDIDCIAYELDQTSMGFYQKRNVTDALGRSIKNNVAQIFHAHNRNYVFFREFICVSGSKRTHCRRLENNRGANKKLITRPKSRLLSRVNREGKCPRKSQQVCYGVI